MSTAKMILPNTRKKNLPIRWNHDNQCPPHGQDWHGVVEHDQWVVFHSNRVYRFRLQQKVLMSKIGTFCYKRVLTLYFLVVSTTSPVG